MSLKVEKKERSTRSKRREVMRKLESDFKELYAKMQANFKENNWELLTADEIKVLDAGTHPDLKMQDQYTKGRGYYTTLMSMKIKYYEFTGMINTSTNEKGDLVFEPGENYKPEVVVADQSPLTAMEIAEANKPSAGLAMMRKTIERNVPNLKRV